MKIFLFCISFMLAFVLNTFAQDAKIYITDSSLTEGVQISHEKEDGFWEKQAKKVDSNQVKLYFDSKKNTYIIGEVSGIYHAKWSGTTWEKTEKINGQNNSLLHAKSTIVCNKIPLELISYTIEKNGINIEINWATVQEESKDYFTLERSTNNKDYKSIAKVEATGSSPKLNNYHYTDKDPEEGINFYRLKHMDDRNECNYPEVRAIYVNRKEDQNTRLYIDRLDGDAKVSYLSRNGENFHMKIIDHTGKEVFEGFIPSIDGITIVNLDFAKFKNQVYFIYIIDPKGNITLMQYDDKVN